MFFSRFSVAFFFLFLFPFLCSNYLLASSLVPTPLTKLQQEVLDIQLNYNLRNMFEPDEYAVGNKIYNVIFKKDKLKKVFFVNEYFAVPLSRSKNAYGYFYLAGYHDTRNLIMLIDQNTCFAMQFIRGFRDFYNIFRYRLFIAPDQKSCKYNLTTVVDDQF